MKSDYPDILCIIPIYNEQGNIKSIVNEILNLDFNIDFVIINDGSNDDSYEIVKKLAVNVINHVNNLGLGCAVQTGYRYAIENGYSYVIRLDGDGQHDPNCIIQFINCLLEDDIDLVIGTRYYSGSQYKKQFWNTLGAFYFSLLLRMKTKRKVTDPTSGFVGMKIDVVKNLLRYSTQEYPEIEAILIVNKLGGELREIPINMYRRKYGKSSITFTKKFCYVVRETLLVLFYSI